MNVRVPLGSDDKITQRIYQSLGSALKHTAHMKSLSKAIKGNDLLKCALLIENVHPGDLNRVYDSMNHSTPLIYCCSLPRKEVVKMLIDKGADVNCVDGDGTSPLAVSIFLDEDLAEMLMWNGADPCGPYNAMYSILHILVYYGKTKLVKTALDSPFVIDRMLQHQLLQIAHDKGHSDIVNLLTK